MNFDNFQRAIQKQFDRMTKDGNALFEANFSKSDRYEMYLGSFPEGTNPLHIVNTQHDCVCCKQFIRAVGSVVAYVDGKLESIWDIDPNTVDEGYAVVAQALSNAVKESGIKGLFVHYTKHVGTEVSYAEKEDGSPIEYKHFHYILPASSVDSVNRAELRGKSVEYKEGLTRSITELNPDDVQMIIDLTRQDSLYKGDEYRPTLVRLQKLQGEYAEADDKEGYLWTKSQELQVAGNIRTTVIGQLLVNLSKGDSLEVAVKKFEDMVAPHNYKRSKALVTPVMIKNAHNTVAELGIEDSLHRRFAVAEDLTINNVLFADRSAKESMGVFDLIGSKAKVNTPNLDKVEEVSIDKFMNDILPKAESIELMVDNSHEPNLVSLVAPKHANAPGIMSWDNNFSYAYKGDVTDANMREQVRSAGGNVDGPFRFTHSWNHDGQNQSLMDLHVFMPGNNKTFNGTANDNYSTGRRVGWNHRQDSASGGIQDVDFTERAGTKIPVENISFPSLSRMPDGEYKCAIHNWSFRGPTLSGFKAEVEINGDLYTYEYPEALKGKEWVHVATVTKKGSTFAIKHHLPHGSLTKEVWGLATNRFHKVSMVMNSPNFWNEQEVGHKHYFFMLEDCVNPDPVRGFYNEFLRSDLHSHRKVFEVLGASLMAESTENQLSGLGFSSTRRASVHVKVSGSFNRIIKINF